MRPTRERGLDRWDEYGGRSSARAVDAGPCDAHRAKPRYAVVPDFGHALPNIVDRLTGTERGTLAAVDPCEDPARPPTITGSGILTGTSGDDVIHGPDGPDIIDGGSGDDLIWRLGGDDDFSDGSGHYEIFGGLGADVASGGSGNDVVVGNGTVDDEDAVADGSGSNACHVDQGLDPSTGVPPSGTGSITSCEAITSGGSGNRT